MHHVHQRVSRRRGTAASGGGGGRSRHRDTVAEQVLPRLLFAHLLHVGLETRRDVLELALVDVVRALFVVQTQLERLHVVFGPDLAFAFQGWETTQDVQDVADGVPARRARFLPGHVRRTTVARPRGSLCGPTTARDLGRGELRRRTRCRRRTARGGASRELLIKERPEGRLLVPSFSRGILVHGQRFAHGHTRAHARRGRELIESSTRTFLHAFQKRPLPRGESHVPTHHQLANSCQTHLTLNSHSSQTHLKLMSNS